MSLETREREMTLSERARDAVVDAGQLLMSGLEWWLLRSSQIPVTPFLDRADFAWAPALEARLAGHPRRAGRGPGPAR